jgi:hypothetical protein
MRSLLFAAIILLLTASAAVADLGDVLTSFPSPYTNPMDLAWDGDYLWHCNWNPDTICKIDVATGNPVTCFPGPASFPTGLTWDGTQFWLADIGEDSLYRLDPVTLVPVESFLAPGGSVGQPIGLAWDGQYLWLNDSRGPEKLYKIDPSTGAAVDTFYIPWSSPYGFAFGGGWLWLSDNNMSGPAAWIYKLDPSDASAVDSFACPGGGGSPNGIAYDGEHLWVAVNTNNRIYRVESGLGPFPPMPVNDLAIEESAFGMRLAWSPIWADTAGNWIQIRAYGIYRSTVGHFVPTAAESVGATADTTWIDLVGAQPEYFYRVKAWVGPVF